MEYFPETKPIKVDMSETTEYDVQLVESQPPSGSK
jgi:hypothetical protein